MGKKGKNTIFSIGMFIVRGKNYKLIGKKLQSII